MIGRLPPLPAKARDQTPEDPVIQVNKIGG